ncbi:MAG: transporter [Eubacteriales bacterium]|nr:transporter [Eubacteriales bacterium]
MAYLSLNFALLLYAGSAVLMKFAGKHPGFSLPFLALYGGALVLLFVYALLWQKSLHHISLFTAYANKGVVLIYAVLFGALLFGESIGFKNILAVLLVLFGIVLVVRHE